MARELAPRTSALAVPSAQELEALGPADRWTLEERWSDGVELLRQFNDEELRRWVEVEGKTQIEIAKLVGRSQSRIQERCARLGLTPKSNRGRPRITGTGNSDSDEEVIDAEVVEDEDQIPPLPAPSPDQVATIREAEHDDGHEAGINTAELLGVQHPDYLDDADESAEPTVSGSSHAPQRGVRAADHQQRLIASVAGRMEDIQTSIGEIDLATAVEALNEKERRQCLLQLRNGRTAVSQLIKALE